MADRTVWMRWAGHCSTAVMILLGLAGCGDIRCPPNLEPSGDACRCPFPAVLSGGSCVIADAGETSVGTGYDGGAPQPAPDGPRDPEVVSQVRDAGNRGEKPTEPPSESDPATTEPIPDDSSTTSAPPPPEPSVLERCRASCDGSCDAQGVCTARQKESKCGDMVWSADEECELGTASAWTAKNCADCKRKYHRLCDGTTPCGTTDETCKFGVCLPNVGDCVAPPLAEQLLNGRENACLRRCPTYPYAKGVLIDWANDCYLRCSGTDKPNECPPGLTCWRANAFLVDVGEERPYVCAPPG